MQRSPAAHSPRSHSPARAGKDPSLKTSRAAASQCGDHAKVAGPRPDPAGSALQGQPLHPPLNLLAGRKVWGRRSVWSGPGQALAQLLLREHLCSRAGLELHASSKHNWPGVREGWGVGPAVLLLLLEARGPWVWAPHLLACFPGHWSASQVSHGGRQIWGFVFPHVGGRIWLICHFATKSPPFCLFSDVKGAHETNASFNLYALKKATLFCADLPFPCCRLKLLRNENRPLSPWEIIPVAASAGPLSHLPGTVSKHWKQ